MYIAARINRIAVFSDGWSYRLVASWMPSSCDIRAAVSAAKDDTITHYISDQVNTEPHCTSYKLSDLPLLAPSS